jgi:hypothetical protein
MRPLRWGGAAACLGMMLIAACQGGQVSHRAVVRPLARVTISSGNLTFTSAAAPGGTTKSRHSGTSAASAGGTVTGSAAAQLARQLARQVDNRPDLGIHVSVSNGTLSGVAVAAGPGRAVPRALGAGGTSWRTTWTLAPSRSYRVTASAINGQGRKTVISGAFRTLTPRRTFSATTTLSAGRDYGVGMPIMITFSRPITDKTAVERALEVRSSKPVTGAWYWMSNTQV